MQRAFVDWMRQIAERVAPAGAVVPPVRTLEDVRMTLVERAAEWPKQWLREGLEQGLEQQRALLCRQAAVRCDTAAEFLARVDPASPS